MVERAVIEELLAVIGGQDDHRVGQEAAPGRYASELRAGLLCAIPAAPGGIPVRRHAGITPAGRGARPS